MSASNKGTTYQRCCHDIHILRIHPVLKPILGPHLPQKDWVRDLNELRIDTLRIDLYALVPLVKYQTILLLLANVANILTWATIIVYPPLGLVVDFEESSLIIVILKRILIEYQLWQIVLPGQDELVRLAALVARSADAIAVAEKASVFKLLLLCDLLQVQSKKEILVIVNHGVRVALGKGLLHDLGVIDVICFRDPVLGASQLVYVHPERGVQASLVIMLQLSLRLYLEYVGDFFDQLWLEVQPKVIQVHREQVAA